MATAKLWIAVAVILAFSTVSGAALWYRGQAIKAGAKQATTQKELETAQSVNAAQQATLDRVLAFKAADDASALVLKAKLESLAAGTDKALQTVRDLERSSANVKAYLNTAIPVELRGLLNPGTDSSPEADKRVAP